MELLFSLKQSQPFAHQLLLYYLPVWLKIVHTEDILGGENIYLIISTTLWLEKLVTHLGITVSTANVVNLLGIFTVMKKCISNINTFITKCLASET